MIVVNKAQGMVVHPAVGNENGTLVNAIMYHCGDRLSSINGVIRPGIVHRIDKDTSGLLMIAKNDMAHESLSQQLAEHSITRRYEALVFNNSNPVELEIGCGKGGFINEKAKLNPSVNFLGVEIQMNVLITGAEAVKNAGLKNVKLLNVGAEILKYVLPKKSILPSHKIYPP